GARGAGGPAQRLHGPAPDAFRQGVPRPRRRRRGAPALSRPRLSCASLSLPGQPPSHTNEWRDSARGTPMSTAFRVLFPALLAGALLVSTAIASAAPPQPAPAAAEV